MVPSAAARSAIEDFPAFEGLGVVSGFVRRVPGVAVNVDRAAALRRLDAVHREARQTLGLSDRTFATAEQVHGSQVTEVPVSGLTPSPPIEGADALITNRRDACLGIYVADCCAVYLVDTRRPVIGLVHSGRKGTELGIVPKAIQMMRVSFDTRPEELVVQLSPCIRPPHYEVDFAEEIVRQCRQAGVLRTFDAGTCTAAHPDLYYSYRREKGRTGRMLALLALR